MAHKLTFKNPDFPDDYEFDIPGIGLVPNGKSVTLTEDQERSYIQLNNATVRDGLSSSEYMKLEGTTEVSGGVKTVLGVDPDELDYTPEAPPVGVTESNAVEGGEK